MLAVLNIERCTDPISSPTPSHGPSSVLWVHGQWLAHTRLQPGSRLHIEVEHHHTAASVYDIPGMPPQDVAFVWGENSHGYPSATSLRTFN